jgi:hypothetical protein
MSNDRPRFGDVVNLDNTTRVIRGSGATWTTITDPAIAQIYAVWGRSANGVWGWLTEISGTASTIWVSGNGVALHRE